MTSLEKLSFSSDYEEGAHALIMERLLTTNMEKTAGYGTDQYCESARAKIREACGTPNAAVNFLVGGTQTNATVIGTLLKPYEGVIAAESGHIALHEGGAIEFTGHKVIGLPQVQGKLSAETVENYVGSFYADENHDHMTFPGMVYISQPTEYGTLYSLKELTALSDVCKKYHMPLYVDGARLAYALAAPDNDVTLKDMGRLCDAFYIGGTKCGALFGEAVVFPDPELIPHFFTMIKQRGALLAKGRLLGLQFDTLFTDGLYDQVGQTAITYADQIRQVLKENDYRFFFETTTNQIFIILENESLRRFGERVNYSFWEAYDENHTVIRLATSWASQGKDVEALLKLLAEKF